MRQQQVRDGVIERMDDGWMLLDQQDRIVDINPATTALLGLSRASTIGNHVSNLLEGEALNTNSPQVDLDLKISAGPGQGIKYVNMRALTLKPDDARGPGRVLFWRDITEKYGIEAARRQARDELLVVLHSISRAAGENQTQGQFLDLALRQVIYSLRCDGGAFWLFGENVQSSADVVAEAYSGFSEGEIEDLAARIARSDLWQMLINLDGAYRVHEAELFEAAEERPTFLSGRATWAMPMMIGPARIGLLWLCREEKRDLTSDELLRASFLAEEVATWIFSQRQRQTAILEGERQRLMRELHDSVTQRLYGLVALTEAVQIGAQRQPGHVDPHVLARIGEHGRQAIREMRLFLYQLQPVDFAREDLVLLLRKRLAAVEGRSDVRTELHADAKIVLTPAEKRALYNVAQEALNNSLKHARAKRVSLQLTKTRTGTSLEIVDDGRGFVVKKADRGGIGLASMKARAAEIGAKFSIRSAPGRGTKVVVRLPARRRPSARGGKV